MKYFSILVFLFVSFDTHSWECGSYDSYSQSTEEHFSLASDVIFGRVISGAIVDAMKVGHDLSFKFDIAYSAKGEKSGILNLGTSPDPPFTPLSLGGYYLIFLFGEDFLSFCSVVKLTGVPIESHGDLLDYSNRTDIQSIDMYKKVAELARNP